MLTTMRMARPWTPWLAVMTILGVLTLGVVVPDLARAAGGRVLTPQDVVSIKVVNQPDMDTTARVETDGTISFPYVGRIRAAGLTEDQVARAIEKQLASRQIVTEPHVLVEDHHLRHAGERAGPGRRAGSLYARSSDESDPADSLGRGASGTPPLAERSRCAAARRSESSIPEDVQAGRGPGAEFRIANNDEVFVDLAPFFLSLWVCRTPGRIPSAASSDGPAGHLGWRRSGDPRIRMADQDQAQVRQRPNLRSPRFA